MAENEVRINIKADTRNAEAGIKGIGQRLDSLGSKLKQMRGPLLGVTAAVTGLGLVSIKSASDLDEAVNKANVTFGNSIRVIREFAKTSAASFGMSKTQANEYTATLGVILQASGLAKSATATMSVELTRLAADLASFNNIPIDVALQKLRSGLVGEVEPLRTVGVLLSQAALDAKAAELGLVGLDGELTEAAKVQARYALILEQTQTAQGDFTRTSGSLANQTRILKARFSDVSAELGTKLLPAVNKLLSMVIRTLDAFSALSPTLQTALVALVGISGALAGIGLALPAVIGGFTALAAFSGPIGAVLLVVAGLAAGIMAAKAAFDHFDGSSSKSLNSLHGLQEEIRKTEEKLAEFDDLTTMDASVGKIIDNKTLALSNSLDALKQRYEDLKRSIQLETEKQRDANDAINKAKRAMDDFDESMSGAAQTMQTTLVPAIEGMTKVMGNMEFLPSGKLATHQDFPSTAGVQEWASSVTQATRDAAADLLEEVRAWNKLQTQLGFTEAGKPVRWEVPSIGDLEWARSLTQASDDAANALENLTLAARLESERMAGIGLVDMTGPVPPMTGAIGSLHRAGVLENLALGANNEEHAAYLRSLMPTGGLRQLAETLQPDTASRIVIELQMDGRTISVAAADDADLNEATKGS